MRMLDMAELSESFGAGGPAGEEAFGSFSNHGESSEVPIVEAKPPHQLPDALDRIEFRAVGRQEQQSEVGFLFGPPLLVNGCMMVLGIVRDD